MNESESSIFALIRHPVPGIFPLVQCGKRVLVDVNVVI